MTSNNYRQTNDFFGDNKPKKHSKTPEGREKTQPAMELTDAIDEFMLMAKVDGRAESTINLYEYVFDRFTKEIGKETPIGDITTKDGRKFLAGLMDEDLKNTTVSIYHRVLNAFFNWLYEESFIEVSPFNQIDEPKTPDKFPRFLKEEEVEALLQAEKDRDGTWAGYRNYVMLLVFLDTGIRLSEFINAKIEDLDIENRSLKVHGKGSKDRNVFFGRKTAKGLIRWLRIRNNVERVWVDTIFISQNGDKLKDRNVQRLITRIQKRAGLDDKKVSPHCLRRTSATLAVKNGLDAFSLKRQFGWEKIETAMRYVHMTDSEIKETYRDSSPLSDIQE